LAAAERLRSSPVPGREWARFALAVVEAVDEGGFLGSHNCYGVAGAPGWLHAASLRLALDETGLELGWKGLTGHEGLMYGYSKKKVPGYLFKFRL